jgi:hypothetical protein
LNVSIVNDKNLKYNNKKLLEIEEANIFCFPNPLTNSYYKNKYIRL